MKVATVAFGTWCEGIRGNPDPKGFGRVNNAVLVLNQNYEPLNVCDVRRALVLILGGKADMLEQRTQHLHTTTRAFQMPSVIRLRAFVRRPRPRVKLSRREIFIRDRFTCQYCGVVDRDLTVDHIVPRCRGGKHEWTNVVASCKTCNHRKGSKSLQDARMELSTVPHEPRPGVYYTIERRLDLRRQPDWLKFLPGVELGAAYSSSRSESPAAD